MRAGIYGLRSDIEEHRLLAKSAGGATVPLPAKFEGDDSGDFAELPLLKDPRRFLPSVHSAKIHQWYVAR